MKMKAGDTVDVSGMDYILWGPGEVRGQWAAKRVEPRRYPSGEEFTVWAFIRYSAGRWRLVKHAPNLDDYKAEVDAKYARTGEELATEGTMLALSTDSGAAFLERATDLVKRSMPAGYRFTSEEIIEHVGLPTEGVGTNKNNAVGGTIRALASAGLIKGTGEYARSKRPTSHGAMLAVWERTALEAPVATSTHDHSEPHPAHPAGTVDGDAA